jgi:hypothetical protein
MSIGLILIRFPLNWLGLFEAIGFGAAVYAVSVMVLDVAGLRSIVLARLRPKLPALSD